MTDSVGLRKWISQNLKFNGFTIRAEATDYLTEQFSQLPESKRKTTLKKLTHNLRSINSDSLVVSREHVESCFKESLLDTPSTETIWNVIDAFSFPRFVYNRETCKFVRDDTVEKKGLFPDVSVKSFMRRRQYTAIMQKVLKNDMIYNTFLDNGKEYKYVVKTVEWFLCQTEKINHAIIVGLLVQKPDGAYAVEDTTGTLDIDLSAAIFTDGLYPEHSFVFLEGVYEDKVFYVLKCGQPPTQKAVHSRFSFDSCNTFGGPSPYTLKYSKTLKEHQNMNPDEMIVFISDLWLDKPQVLKQLKVMFDGYSGFPPFAFVFLGNFVSSQKVASYAEQLKRGFMDLASLIASYDSICKKSHFVLVPGPYDIGYPKILPRPPLSKSLVKDLVAKVPNLTLATNPCRIQYCTREIVVIREDLLTKLCRNTIHFPKNAAERIPFHFSKTLICQGNLAPMSLLVCPVYWNFSHSLDLFPLPDLVVASDQLKSFTENYMDCIVTSPGSFVKEKFSFKVYLPSKNEVEDSCIPEET